MRLLVCLLLVTCIWASENESRAKKQPFVVDAVGNTLPPPSNVPATVGSPVNLLTPDRYEFYTFDESGELVKRLMTLEEIQAIVAAGEEAEGLVTFANDNQPTMAFNFSQPPYNKVHSVVTNVQNVLKAQMEAHKNNPVSQPSLDTPDVSDSWSLILPSIFGNTGLDIIPDKISNGVTPPETDTLDFNDANLDLGSDFSKEGDSDVLSSTSTQTDSNLKSVSTTPAFIDEAKITTRTVPSTTTTVTPTTTTTMTSTTTKTTSTTTTAKPTTTSKLITTAKLTTTSKPTTTAKLTTTAKSTTTTLKPIRRTTTTTVKPSTIKHTTTRQPITKQTTVTTKKTTKPLPTTESTVETINRQEPLNSTKLPLASSPSTSTNKTHTTTSKPKVTNNIRVTSTTPKPSTVTSTKTAESMTSKITTSEPLITTKQPVVFATTPKISTSYVNKNEISNTITATDKNTMQYEKIDILVPISTTTYLTENNIQTVSYSKKPEILSDPKTTNYTATTEKLSLETQKSEPVITTFKPTTVEPNYISSTAHSQDPEKLNITTITTQSVSPSTTMSSTEFIKLENLPNSSLAVTNPLVESHSGENTDSDLPLFDVAQSISQIASDLGGSYMPIATVSSIVDTTKVNQMDLESKENFELEILTDADSKKPNDSENEKENFVKISTLDPHDSNDKDNKTNAQKDSVNKENLNAIQRYTTEKNIMATLESTTIDKILSESMGDLLSQVVNQAPILDSKNDFQPESNINTTETNNESTTIELFSDIVTTTFRTLDTYTLSANDIPNLEKPENETFASVSSNTSVVIEDKPVPAERTENKEDNKTYVKVPIVNDNNNSISNNQTDVLRDKTISDNKEKSTESASTETSRITTNISHQNHKSSTIKPITQEVAFGNETKDSNNISSIADAINKVQINKTSDNIPKIDDFKKKIQKVNIDDKELANERNNSWKLISTVSPPKSNDVTKEKFKNNAKNPIDNNSNKDIILDFSKENQGLEVTTKDLEEDIAKFTELCNELAFRYWNAITENIDKRRSFVLSPYAITSMLAMMFMGARGATSGEMNDILKLDDMVTFNPHFTLKNISDSIETTPESGVMVSAFIRELYSDRNKGKILTFYKERAQQFYNGHVEEINFKLISDIIRRRTNLLVKRYTWGKISEYMKANTIIMQPPLAAFSANIFQTDCTGSSVEGRDGEMYFVVSPTVRQRRLVPVPAVVYRGRFLAGYDPVLDATAAALGNTNSIISTLFVMPGQQGNVVHGQDLEALEQRLLDTNPTTPAWNRLLRTLLPRIGLELQIPRFSHKSIFNVSSTLKNMGLKDLFDAQHADLGGLNGPSKDLYLSDMIQSTSFVTCGEGIIGEQHHIEEYPESVGSVARRRSSRWTSDWDEPRDYQRAFHDPHDVGEAMHLPLHLRPRQARLPSRNAQPARLKFDRPFLYLVRHNPSGMILYVGRYNPRLLP